ncbi:uncharacterized protein LOC144165053 [Haemaphysalis longicornis]
MEKKRNRVAATAPSSSSSSHDGMEMCTCAEKDAEIASLKEKVASLEADLVTARECLDSARMVKRLKRMLASAEAAPAPPVVAAEQVDIGNGVQVDAGTLARIKADSKGSACRFARSMVRLLFTPEELVGRSLYGRKSNSHKEAAVKDAIDPVRWNAILNYTVKEYGVPGLQIKNSLSTLLARGY